MMWMMLALGFSSAIGCGPSSSLDEEKTHLAVQTHMLTSTKVCNTDSDCIACAPSCVNGYCSNSGVGCYEPNTILYCCEGFGGSCSSNYSSCSGSCGRDDYGRPQVCSGGACWLAAHNPGSCYRLQ